MNIQHVDYILELAKEKSFSRAAKNLYMTQSALSQYVHKQEKQLGITLINRGGSALSFTPEGELYVKTLQKIKTDMRDFHNQLADLTNMSTGRICIGTSPFRATNLFPRLIREFTEKYPGIELEIVSDNMKRLKDGLLSGDIDFCIDNNHFDENTFHTETLFTETHYLAVPKEHPLNQTLKGDALSATDIGMETDHFFTAAPVDLTQCASARFILPKPGSGFYACHQKIYKEAGFTPTRTTFVDNIETAFRWTETGMALSLIPDSLILHGNYKNHPNYYKLDLLHNSQDIVFCIRSGRYVSIASRTFLDILRTLIGYGTWNMQ